MTIGGKRVASTRDAILLKIFSKKMGAQMGAQYYVCDKEANKLRKVIL